jgi:hypothetical protein
VVVFRTRHHLIHENHHLVAPRDRPNRIAYILLRLCVKPLVALRKLRNVYEIRSQLAYRLGDVELGQMRYELMWIHATKSVLLFERSQVSFECFQLRSCFREILPLTYVVLEVVQESVQISVQIQV